MVKHCILFFFLLVFYNLQLAAQNIREWINIECYQTDNYSYKNSQRNNDLVVFMGNSITEGWVTDKETIACRLLESLARTNPQAIEQRYKITGVELLQGWEILEMIGRKRGFLVKGGEIDYERSSVIVADEFRGGKLGRITLELP